MTGKTNQLTEQQRYLAQLPIESKVLVVGPAGCGKTTAAVNRIDSLIRSGASPQSILVLVPQRSLGLPYRERTQSNNFPAGGEVSVITLGGLAQRMISLFWPLLGANSGFKEPNRTPQFLTLETAQYYLAQIISPLLQKGYFESITIDPNRLFSQVLDNLNKSAVVGFDPHEISTRLKAAWSGVSKQAVVYDQVQDCALRFREFCLQHNLLDYSLQFEIFSQQLWPSTLCQAYLKKQFQHLIYDNIEEDVPVAHDIIRSWFPDFHSAFAIMDTDAGFRTFMGADRISAESLAAQFPETIQFSQSLVQSEPIQAFQEQLSFAIREHKHQDHETQIISPAFSIQPFRFYPQAIDRIVSEVAHLIKQESVPAGQIVILTPFLSDSLRFSITERFQEQVIDFSTFRPSRSLQDEPVVKTLLTCAKLAHSQWKLKPTRHDIRYALMQIIPQADLIRSDLIAQILYSPSREEEFLGSFSQIRPEMQQRITFTVGNKFDSFKEWLAASAQHPDEELDTFFSRLFGELLSQPQFGFHNNFEAASIVSRLIESCRKFRSALTLENFPQGFDIGKEYVSMVEQGVISAQYLSSWDDQKRSDSVLIAPAFTFLMSNRPAAYQFWLDVGSSGWNSRLDQPLTQPYILSRNWQPDQKWTNRNETEADQDTLLRVTTGLLRRCSTKVNLISIGVNESGNEERGALLVALQTVLRGLNPAAAEKKHV